MACFFSCFFAGRLRNRKWILLFGVNSLYRVFVLSAKCGAFEARLLQKIKVLQTGAVLAFEHGHKCLSSAVFG